VIHVLASRVSRTWSAAVALAVLGACHPTDQPPLPPPKPTDPSTLASMRPSSEVIDASIVSEGGTSWDATFELDTGASATTTVTKSGATNSTAN
jgi:hypothetical protein